MRSIIRPMPTDRSSGELARLIRAAPRADSPNAVPGATATFFVLTRSKANSRESRPEPLTSAMM